MPVARVIASVVYVGCDCTGSISNSADEQAPDHSLEKNGALDGKWVI
jgi:hypothetical protein